jgi:hypothetical protein
MNVKSLQAYDDIDKDEIEDEERENQINYGINSLDEIIVYFSL